jgi:rhomboid family GlyGly-CTERM serine protease
MSRRFLFRRTRDPLAPPSGAHGLTGMATLLLTLSFVFQSMGEPFHTWLRYDREAVMGGQLWRVLTSHLLHLSWAHLLLNAVGLALLTALLGKQQRASDWWLATFFSALAIGVGLMRFSPGLHWYVGLSGVLHGLFAAGCVALLRRHPGVALLSIAGLTFKLGWEQFHPVSPAREALVGGAIVIDAHLYGAVGGALAAVGVHLRPVLRELKRGRCGHRRTD